MKLYDTHCHLNADDFKDDVENYLSRAHEAGVHTLNVIGWDLDSSRKAIELADKYQHVYAVIGTHPSDVFKVEPSVLLEIESLAKHPKVVAIGEIGLDYYWHKDPSEHDIQKAWFIAQIDLANKLNLPIVIHMREATQDTYEILKNHPVKRPSVMHCYSSSLEMAYEFMKLGYYISLGGPVTFKNAKEPKRVAEMVPVDRLLIETDSPYLAPHPYRGKVNESSLLPLMLKEVALLKNVDEETLAAQLFANSHNVFHVERL